MSTSKKTVSASAKKEAAPSKKEVVLKDGSFLAKKVGANLIATIKGSPTERYARAVSKELGDDIMKKMEIYNKRPSGVKKQEIVDLLTPDKAKAKKEKETVVAKAKGVKQQIKKEIKKSKSKVADKETKSLVDMLDAELAADSTGVDKLQAILDKYKKKEEQAPTPVVAPVTKHYRDEYK